MANNCNHWVFLPLESAQKPVAYHPFMALRDTGPGPTGHGPHGPHSPRKCLGLAAAEPGRRGQFAIYGKALMTWGYQSFVWTNHDMGLKIGVPLNHLY